ncbi:MAG TPA: acyltransferase family protein [Acidimicrobiales bacterium]|nr:acyltransferase family protein [Acidimicrobiales bacterium]
MAEASVAATAIDAEEEAPSARQVYLPFIDGLRAFAVVAVIAFHVSDTLLPGGFLGVDVFFVISGFVVSMSVAHFDSGRVFAFVTRFIARRMRRIVPALVVCLVVSELLSVLLVPAVGIVKGPERVGLHAFFAVSNRAMVQVERYFADATDYNPFTHTWSLGVEEQFYLLFPLAFVGWVRGRKWRLVSIGAVGVAFLWTLRHARALSLTGHRTLAFYSLTTRLWQIAAGVLLYQFAARRGRDAAQGAAPEWLRVPGATVSALVLVAAMVLGSERSAPWPAGAIVVAATAGLLACLLGGKRGSLLRRVLESAPAVHVGKRSYSLYLWHWPVLVFFRWTIGLDSGALVVTALVLTAALAEASYRFVELPIRRGPLLRGWADWAVVLMGLAVLAASFGAMRVAVDRKSSLSMSTVARNQQDWVAEEMPLKPPAPGCRVQRRERREGPATVVIFERHGCDIRPLSDSTLYVAGDSHAYSYRGLLRQFVLDTGVSVRIVSEGGCPFLLGLHEPLTQPHCPGIIAATLAELRSAQPGDVLFLASLHVHPLTYHYARRDVAAILRSPFGTSAGPSGTDGEAEAIATLAPLTNRGVDVVFEAPLPVFAAPHFRCADVFNRSNPICASGFAMSKSVLEQYRAPVLSSMLRVGADTGAQIWDPMPTLCGASVCRAARAGRPLFFDGDHLSGYGNRVLVASFETTMIPLLRS